MAVIVAGKRKIKYKILYQLEKRCGGNFLKVLQRDNYVCAICGNDNFPMVHHLDGNIENVEINNLLTVCRQCHAELHGITLRLTNPSMELIVELRRGGKTYQEIGDYLGISRQRVHQIIKGHKKSNRHYTLGIEERLKSL